MMLISVGVNRPATGKNAMHHTAIMAMQWYKVEGLVFGIHVVIFVTV
jgi:hypothetical protein